MFHKQSLCITLDHQIKYCAFFCDFLFVWYGNKSQSAEMLIIVCMCHCIYQHMKKNITGCAVLLELLDKPLFDVHGIITLDY